MRIPDMIRKAYQNSPLSEVTCLIDGAPVNMKLVCVEFAETRYPYLCFSTRRMRFIFSDPKTGRLARALSTDQQDPS